MHKFQFNLYHSGGNRNTKGPSINSNTKYDKPKPLIKNRVYGIFQYKNLQMKFLKPTKSLIKGKTKNLKNT